MSHWEIRIALALTLFLAGLAEPVNAVAPTVTDVIASPVIVLAVAPPVKLTTLPPRISISWPAEAVKVTSVVLAAMKKAYEGSE